MPQTLQAAYQYVEHVPGSPEEVFEIDRSQATRIYDVAWADRIGIARALLGSSGIGNNFVLGVNSPYITRAIPHAHPEALLPGGAPYLFATRITKCEGIGAQTISGSGANAIATYQKARLSVQYTTPTYEILSDAEMTGGAPNTYPDESQLRRYVTFQPRPNVDMLSINRGIFKRVDSLVPKQPIQQGTSKTIVSNNFQITWHQIPKEAVPLRLINPNPPFGTATANYAIDFCLGKVNQSTFAGYPRGTVLLIGCEIRPCKSAFGKRIYDIIYMFKVFNPRQNYGHQHIFLHLPFTAIPQQCTDWNWIEVTTDGHTNLVNQTDGISIYDWEEFSDLFRPVQ